MKIVINVIVGCLFLLSPLSADSCTVFRLMANDGSTIIGRSMEFSVDLLMDGPSAEIEPRHQRPALKEGLRFYDSSGPLSQTRFP